MHLRTTYPIESTFGTVRHRTKVTRGPGSRAAGRAMAFKLIEAAQARWRTVNAPQLVALVRVGARFEAGKLIERPDAHPVDTPHRGSRLNNLDPQVLTIAPRLGAEEGSAEWFADCIGVDRRLCCDRIPVKVLADDRYQPARQRHCAPTSAALGVGLD